MPHVPTPHLPTVHWPWQHRAAPAAEPVHELLVRAAGEPTDAYPQFWKRDTLVIDLRAARGSGGLELTPREGGTWPVRLAFRVAPGTLGQLEVRGAQRTVFPISTAPGAPSDLELAPGAYTLKTPGIQVNWTP